MSPRWSCILLATLCLLTLATSAAAECAWVLWSEARDKIVPVSAFAAKEECDARERKLAYFQRQMLDAWQQRRAAGRTDERMTELASLSVTRGCHPLILCGQQVSRAAGSWTSAGVGLLSLVSSWRATRIVSPSLIQTPRMLVLMLSRNDEDY